MKQNSVIHDSCLGLAIAAMTPLVIGTNLVMSPSAEAASSSGLGIGIYLPAPSRPDIFLPESFLVDTWMDVHEELFGPPDNEDEYTTFWFVDAEIEGKGLYVGNNAFGEVFMADVIRFHSITIDDPDDSNPSAGVAWATISTDLGEVNLVLLTMAWDDGGTTAGSGQVTGFLPIIDHDSLMSSVIPNHDVHSTDDPPPFSFSHMDEDYDPNSGQGCIYPCVNCPQGGGIWCPHPECDPVIQLAMEQYRQCLRNAALALAACLATVAATFLLHNKVCLGLVWSFAGWAGCLSAASLNFAIATAACLAIYAASVADCRAALQGWYDVSKQLACGSEPSPPGGTDP